MATILIPLFPSFFPSLSSVPPSPFFDSLNIAILRRNFAAQIGEKFFCVSTYVFVTTIMDL